MIEAYYADKYVTIYHGDSREILPTLPAADLVLTDPPYGIGYIASNPSVAKGLGLKPAAIANDGGGLNLSFVLGLSCDVVAFGANCYPDQLPTRGRWICWDKRVVETADKMLGSPFELAWTNRASGYDVMLRIQHGGVVNADGWNRRRVHPTQKPLALMSRIIQLYPDALLIVDPFMGSGTTLRAAKDLQRRAIGIEIEENYCEIAARRMAQGVLDFEGK